ncbi:MAG TPA: DKNYY domain-containing protein [Pirellulaceae bacterium]|nr:DKNYY domain-containing protein [Pirellulaceae bacterium]
MDDANGQLTILSDVNYAATSEHVYLWGVMIPHADPASFQLLTYPYSRDSKRAYCGTVPMRDANPASIKVLGGQLDPSFVSRAEAYEILVGPITTVSSDSAIIGALGWSADEDTVFFGPNPIMGARPQSFRLLNDLYATDGSSVFFGREKLERADPETFRVVNFTSAEDRNYTYKRAEATKRSDRTQNGQEKPKAIRRE